RERPLRRRPSHRLERADDRRLHHVEYVLAFDERHLEVELAELELTVGAEILVAPARGDLVVAVVAADHAELLEELRRLGEREELPGLQADRHEEVARAFGCAARHARRPDVDEVALVHDPADAGDRPVREAQVVLHAPTAHVEPAVAQANGLVDVLLVDLERQRRRAREDAQLVDLQLDLAGRQVRVDRLRRARDDLADGLDDELVAELLRDLGFLEDELHLAGVIAEIDEDESAVIAARVDPAGEGQALPDVLRTHKTALKVAPAHGALRVATRSSSATAWSVLPSRRTVAPPAPTTTIVLAPDRPACVSWPFSERPA